MTQQGPQQQAPQQFDFMAEILRRAGLVDENGKPDPSLAPIGFAFRWGKQGAFDGAGVWKVEQPVPFEGYGFLSIAFLFQSEHDVTIYAMPKGEPPKDPNTGEPLILPVPHRFTLNKTSAAYFTEIIANPEVLMDEVADELAALAGLDQGYDPNLYEEEEEDEEEEEGEEEPSSTTPT